MSEREKADIELGILSIGREWDERGCQCDPDVGCVPCHYCAEYNAIMAGERLLEQLATAHQCWEQLEQLRSQGWCVVVKALPDRQPFIIEGGHSEYDATCEDTKLWRGKWVCEVQWMRWGETPETRYRAGTAMAGDTPEQAVAEAYRILKERGDVSDERAV